LSFNFILLFTKFKLSHVSKIFIFNNFGQWTLLIHLGTKSIKNYKNGIQKL
jgi:hypothetical protein